MADQIPQKATAAGLHLFSADIGTEALLITAPKKDFVQAAQIAKKLTTDKKLAFYGATILSIKYEGVIDA